MKKYLEASAACFIFAGSGAFAGGADLSGQPLGALFQSGTYAELTYAQIMPKISGKDYTGASTGNIGLNFGTSTLSYKTDFSDKLSVAMIYDQPYGRTSAYSSGAWAGIKTEVVANAITLAGRYKITNRWSVHGGVRMEDYDTTVILPVAGYELQNSKETDLGYLLGVSYEIPEYLTLFTLTYNFGISHDFTPTENGVVGKSYNYTTPESVNFDFHMPVSKSTLLFGGMRYAAYGGQEIRPPGWEALTGGAALVAFESDAISYSLGVAQKLTDNLNGIVRIGYEAPVGVTQDPFNPVDGMKSIGLGVNYIHGKMNVTVGVDYAEFGETTGVIGEFKNSRSTALGIKVGYTF